MKLKYSINFSTLNNFLGAALLAIMIFNLSFSQIYNVPVNLLIPFYFALNVLNYKNLRLNRNLFGAIYIFLVLWYLTKLMIYASRMSYIPNLVLSEIILIILITPLSYLISSNLKQGGINNFLVLTGKISSLLSIPIILFSYFKFYSLLSFGDINQMYFDNNNNIIYGTSLSKDYNVFAFGLICIYTLNGYVRSNLQNSRMKILLRIHAFLLVPLILFSTSRRAVIVIMILWINRWIKLSSSSKMISFVVLGFIILTTFYFVDADVLIDRNLFYRISELDLFNNDRLDRFLFARDLFIVFNPMEIFTGKNLEFLQLYRAYFFTYPYVDYPHNFLLTFLLFLGLPYTILYTVLMLIRLRLLFQLNQTLFLITIMFVFLALTSSFSIYSISITSLLISLLFFIDFNSDKKAIPSV